MVDLDILADLCKHGFSRYGITFKTNSESYFYDSGTGKVFACEELEYFILDTLLKTSDINALKSTTITAEKLAEGIHNIVYLIQDEKILSLPKNLLLVEPPAANHLQQLILKLTEECNLRCEYCVYQETSNNFQTFHNRHMTFEIAKHAIDHALLNAKDTLLIGFYDGEPLINYPLMEQCISYIEHHKEDLKRHYSMTKNLTLVNEKIANYLACLENIIILYSFDGPLEAHSDTYLYTTYRYNS